MIRPEESLAFHAGPPAGKVEIRPTKACLTPRDMRLAYLPGAVFPAQAIAAEEDQVFRLTARANLVGVVTNGTAVPGLGAVGPYAAKPMQEGTAVLFKRLADIDVFDLELDETDSGRMIEIVESLEPTFGGINLKDIRAPEGLIIHERLSASLRIPVFHENLYGTAVVAMAALRNALDLAEKKLDACRVVICGAGTVGIGCARLLLALGLPAGNLALYDVLGLIHPEREDLHAYQRALARPDAPRTLVEGLRGADVFLGASVGGVLTPDMLRSMGSFPIVLALAAPEPEIAYDLARASRRDALVATSSDRSPNVVLDLLSFPYIFRGALDVRATRITEGMLLAAVRALADLAREDVPEEVERAYGRGHFAFGPEYLLPKPLDPRILVWESAAVARQAIEEKVARISLEPDRYREQLSIRIGTGRETMRGLILKARQQQFRVVLADGAHETILRASGILVDEGIASPILVGPETEILAGMNRLGLELRGVRIVDPERSPSLPAYAEEYFRLRQRRGVMLESALEMLRRSDRFATMMLRSGEADLALGGLSSHYAESLRTILEIIGPAPGVRRVSSVNLLLRGQDAYFLADCAVQIEPDAEELAETALLAAAVASALGFEPRVAMLSFSNFGSVDHPLAAKVRKATEIAKSRAPDLAVDGEMQLATAVNEALRKEYFPFSVLPGNANVLVFPDVQSGNLALHTLQILGNAVAVGPLLVGTRHPVHLLQYGATVEDVVNLVAASVVEAASRRPGR
jgi:malate dehydrogenase (oxaloacetate-decarboxylating)(NADP+)